MSLAHHVWARMKNEKKDEGCINVNVTKAVEKVARACRKFLLRNNWRSAERMCLKLCLIYYPGYPTITFTRVSITFPFFHNSYAEVTD
jgi:hypothetical protein